MENFTQYFSMIMIVIAVLAALTNLVVEVLKNIFKSLATNIVVLVVAIILTFVAFFIWIDYAQIALVWYFVVAAVIVGIMVAYAAMFGYDKLKEVLDKAKGGTGGQL